MITQIMNRDYTDVYSLMFFLLLFPTAVVFAENKEKINIKSDRVEYNYKDEEEVAVFIGSVEFKKGELVVLADKMQMYSQGKKAVAEDNVKIIIDTEDENRVLTSGYFEYHRDDEYAILKKNPKMVIINKKQESGKKIKDFKDLTIIGDIMEMFSKDGYSRALGNVIIEEGDRKAYCDEAIYYEKDDKVIMTGSARIEQNENKFQGEKMTLFLNEDRLIIEGKVEGMVVEK